MSEVEREPVLDEPLDFVSTIGGVTNHVVEHRTRAAWKTKCSREIVFNEAYEYDPELPVCAQCKKHLTQTESSWIDHFLEVRIEAREASDD